MRDGAARARHCPAEENRTRSRAVQAQNGVSLAPHSNWPRAAAWHDLVSAHLNPPGGVLCIWSARGAAPVWLGPKPLPPGAIFVPDTLVLCCFLD